MTAEPHEEGVQPITEIQGINNREIATLEATGPLPGLSTLELTIRQSTDQLYNLLEGMRIYALELSDKTFAQGLRKIQRQLYIKQANVLRKLEECVL